MSGSDPIKDILEKYGEPIVGNVWRVQNATVIYHKTVERIAAKARIEFDPPTILRAERDEAVLLVSGRMGDRRDWTIGEALVNINYRVSGKQAAYVYAIAEKRARDRLVLKLIGLHGLLYSEDESDDFKEGRSAQSVEADPETGEVKQPPPASARPNGSETVVRGGKTFVQRTDGEYALADHLKRKIDGLKSIDGVTDYMIRPETQKALNDLTAAERDEVRDHAKARLVALGWPSKKSA